ncbi:general amidase [Pluteus cervinus]|uniref:General amidase n=1 Tax=Pluteus cervinus TaxID=181527 RepID=A0ACD3BHD5_9AGAR|nr:general amidase [Pluteus cervinus]
MANTWQQLVADKRNRQVASIPKDWLLEDPPAADVLDVTRIPETCGILTAQEIRITNASVGTLLQNLSAGEWSAFEVTTAFAKRAIIAHQLTNCLTEIFIDRALERAKELDEYRRTHGKVFGPLHGLPISLKDQICIKGLEATMGYASWIGRYSTSNSVLVDTLESLGAVLYVKTNIPQTLMFAETNNLVFGRTLNPYNRSATSGGSSGGEGALIGLKGSPLGVGSDIGGSIRIPSGFCGLYALRPSYGRVPYAGNVNSLEGEDSILSVLGPMSNSLDGVKVFMKSVVGQKTWERDPLVTRMPWDEAEYSLASHGGGRNLCFAIIWDDGIVVPHPPITRGLEMTKRALLAAGHKVLDWKPLKHKEMYDIALGIWGAASAEDYKAVTATTGEPVLTTMDPEPDQDTYNTQRLRLGDTKGSTAYELWQVQRRKREIREEYLQYWNDTIINTGTGRPVDAIISPVAAYAAPPHGQNRDANYTTVWNVLDYSAAVLPVTKVIPSLDVQRPAHKFYDHHDRYNYELYNPSKFAGEPVAIQVIGRTHEEEAVIAMAEIVDAALQAQKARL